MQCTRHGIAAGPDGQCALCRRETTPPGSNGGKRVIGLSVLGLALIGVALVLARPLGALPSPAFSVTRTPPRITAEPEAVETAGEREPEPEPLAVAERGTDELAADTPSPSLSAEREATASAPAVSASAVDATPSPSASQARPTDAVLTSAIRATPIVMFSTDWCGVCARARAFMNANGLRYSERDIDRDTNARDELKRRTGKASIPTIEIDGELLTPGFSEREIMSAVAASAKRRLGIDELEVRRIR